MDTISEERINKEVPFVMLHDFILEVTYDNVMTHEPQRPDFR